MIYKGTDMAHFAKIENNIVVQVIVIHNSDIQNLNFPESEKVGQDYIKSIGLEGTWIQTSYNKQFRKNYAGINYTYDDSRDAFIPPKPYPSWILNNESAQWVPPKPYPINLEFFHWDENIKNWRED